MKRGLAFKLTLGGILVVLIPILVVGLFSATKSSKALEETTKSQSMETAKGLASMVHMVFLEELKIVSDWSIKSAVIEAATKTSKGETASAANEIEKLGNELSATMQKIGKDYETIVLADVNGNCFVDGIGGKTKGINVTERDYFKEAKAGKTNLGNPSKSKLTGNPIVPVCAPIYSKAGEFVGAVSFMVNINFLSEKIGSVKLGNTGYAYMLDKKGVIIAHPKKEFILDEKMAAREDMKDLLGKMTMQQTGAETYTFQGVKKLVGYAPVELTGWSVAVSQNMDEVMAPAHSIRNFIAMIGIIFLGVTILAVLFFSRGITRPIAATAAQLNEAAGQVASASSQVSSASQSLAEGTSEQAAGLEETSSSIEEMASMTKQNADNARQANTLMTEASQVVNEADRSMIELTGSMKEITTASEETAKIIKTIDEIAFQTNLLALNAAVEAARAGEAGAGFAVVADEVRNLAMRASDAAKNTANLIEGSVKKIKDGSDLVTKTNEAFVKVATYAKKVGGLVGEIAAASNEQAQGVGQINKAVSEMDKVVQKNAASAEESASAAEEMNAQSEQMKAFVAELMTVIDGGGNGNGNGGVFAQPLSHKGGNEIHAMAMDHRPKARVGIRKALPAPDKSLKAKVIQRVALKQKQVKPDQVIPMEEGDFQEF